jgi:hypothetical protein
MNQKNVCHKHFFYKICIIFRFFLTFFKISMAIMQNIITTIMIIYRQLKKSLKKILLIQNIVVHLHRRIVNFYHDNGLYK